MVEGGEVVLKTGEFVEPIPANQIRSCRQRLPHLDEAGPQVGEGAQQGAGQPFLHLWILAAAPQQQAQNEPQQGPNNLDQSGHHNPRPQQ